MLSDVVILLYTNIHTDLKTQELLLKFIWDVCSHPPHTAQIWHPIWFLNTYLDKVLQTSDVKTAAENSLNWQGRDFYQSGLTKLVLRSDKCLNKFGDYVVK
ncbi:hypothetical protein AVEN_141593-1 [Araneus ventricosus]|uniref:Uncharacterized protein n=1 Tax=Araneus ventricosus TaxID=182803 RepID=A0A4Y2TY41_ARAVE|nr:hypothetical protein AVEN_141593-1 [Araneus ventricosus]